MTAYIVAGALVPALWALALTPMRIDAAYEAGAFTLTGRAGPVPVRLFPGRKPRKSGGPRDTGVPRRRLSPPVLRLLADCGCRCLGRLGRRAYIRALRARYTAGGPDPYRACMAYARAGLAMEGVARLVDGAQLRAEVVFDSPRPAFTGEISVAARLWAVCWAAACFGMDFLRGYFRYKREKE